MCRLEKRSSVVRAQPVGQFLRPGGLDEGVAGGAKNGNEYLGLANLPALPVNDRHSLAGVIDEQLFADAVFLTHDYVDLGRPEAVVLAEPAVLEALRMSKSILLPKQGQSYAGAAQLGMHPCPVRQRTLFARHRPCRRKQASIQLRTRDVDGPLKPTCREPTEVVSRTRMANGKASGDLAHGQAGVEF